ncbi:MAG TPA: hypothetical protein VEP89_07225, partial [Draconibacterium sp.]|nr:hypothetical protein [Draconibacterium sp.]
IREEMLRILKSNESFSELNEASFSILEEIRHDFKGFKIDNYSSDRPLIIKEDKLLIYTFTGTKINKSLSFLFNLTGRESSLDDHSSSFEIDKSDFKSLLKDINSVYNEIDTYLINALDENESLIGFSKWGSYLPIKYQAEILKERYFDFESAINFINNVNIVLIN